MKGLPSQINLPVSILREGKRFVAYTPVLDLSTSGVNYEEVKRRFREAVEIFFQEILRKGTFVEVLNNLGWEKVRTGWIPPVLIAHESQAIWVPLKK